MDVAAWLWDLGLERYPRSPAGGVCSFAIITTTRNEFAPNFTIECQWSWGLRFGLNGWDRNRPTQHV